MGGGGTQWWCTLLTPAIGGSLQSELQDSQGYTVKSYFEKLNKKQKRIKLWVPGSVVSSRAMILALKSPRNVKTNKKNQHTPSLSKGVFSSSRESSEQEGPVPGLRAAWAEGRCGFCRSGSQRAQRAHTPFLCSGSKPEYLLSEYESHYHPHFCFSQITKELSAVSRASVALGGGGWRGNPCLCCNWGESALKSA